jgi:hypothetical protein
MVRIEAHSISGADLRPLARRIGVGHWATDGLLAMDLAGKAAVPGTPRFSASGRLSRPSRLDRYWSREVPAQHAALIGSRVGYSPFADQPMAATCGDDSGVEGRNGGVDQHSPVGARLGFGELHRPTCIAVLLPQPCPVIAPALRDATSLDLRLLAEGNKVMALLNEQTFSPTTGAVSSR